jgi:hypothetical protein
MEPTHASVNRHIANNTVMGFSLNQYLQQELKWNSGIETDLGGKKVWEWLEEGGRLEDSPFLRSFNHFHDPTRTLDVAGLWGGNLGRSSIVWAQTPDQPWGFYSWRDVRNYFYSALTSPNPNEALAARSAGIAIVPGSPRAGPGVRGRAMRKFDDGKKYLTRAKPHFI